MPLTKCLTLIRVYSAEDFRNITFQNKLAEVLAGSLFRKPLKQRLPWLRQFSSNVHRRTKAEGQSETDGDRAKGSELDIV